MDFAGKCIDVKLQEFMAVFSIMSFCTNINTSGAYPVCGILRKQEDFHRCNCYEYDNRSECICAFNCAGVTTEQKSLRE